MCEQYLGKILIQFKIPSGTYDFVQIRQGFVNDTYVNKSTAPIFILQRINKAVFTNIEEVIANMEKGLQYLSDEDYRLISLLSTKRGNPFYIDDLGCAWRLMTFVDESITYGTISNANLAFGPGRIIGKFHKLVENASTDRLAVTMTGFHALCHGYGQFMEALGKADPKLLFKAKKAISYAGQNLDRYLGLLRFSRIAYKELNFMAGQISILKNIVAARS